MEKIDFKNKPDKSTPLSAENMNKLQENVEKEFKNYLEYEVIEEF